MTHNAAPLLASAFALALGYTLLGCTDAGLCTRGEVGCACMDDHSCARGATCGTDDRCTDEGGSGGAGGTGGKTEPPDAGPVDCSGTSVEQGCRGYCESFCQYQAQFCIASRCDPGDCEPNGKLLMDCVNLCNDRSNPLSCARDACAALDGAKCSEFGYFDKSCDETDPKCVYNSSCVSAADNLPKNDPICVLNPDHGCSDTCGTSMLKTGGQLAGDGKCDDGADGSSTSRCPRGTDCTDCGPRKCAKVGEACTAQDECCGSAINASRCAGLSGDVLCRKVCEGDQMNKCPAGLTCKLSNFKNGDSVRLCMP
jgi:hypothetical protein